MADQKPVTMLCLYKPKPGSEKKFQDLLDKHWPALRSVDLATDIPAKVWRAVDKSGAVYFVERFQWKHSGASQIAHQTPEVMSVWEPMGAIADDLQFLEIEPVAMPFDEA